MGTFFLVEDAIVSWRGYRSQPRAYYQWRGGGRAGQKGKRTVSPLGAVPTYTIPFSLSHIHSVRAVLSTI